MIYLSEVWTHSFIHYLTLFSLFHALRRRHHSVAPPPLPLLREKTRHRVPHLVPTCLGSPRRDEQVFPPLEQIRDGCRRRRQGHQLREKGLVQPTRQPHDNRERA